MSKLCFAEAFKAAFVICEDPTYFRPVSLIVARTNEQVSQGYDVSRSFEDAMAEIESETKESNPEKFQQVVKAARIGLGLQRSDVQIPRDLPLQ